ncbi:Catabolic 3-dehydroquinase [Cytospora paraplurivora]|uniref:Catabolic 3-dehydroquinase n=1 Tax=Cytospora paraplurivora TaxID=2898453 RepID=A0AAN9YDN0_9PEZI
MPHRILLINGPNLNLLGTREPQIYGSTTLTDVIAQAQAQARALGVTLATFQSNHEGAIVDRIQEAAGFFYDAADNSNISRGDNFPTRSEDLDPREIVSAIIINPGAYTHTSVAIRDALLGVDIPFVEVHVSNVQAREQFRRHSYLSDKAVAVVAGLGVYGYEVALEFVARHLKLNNGE